MTRPETGGDAPHRVRTGDAVRSGDPEPTAGPDDDFARGRDSPADGLWPEPSDPSLRPEISGASLRLDKWLWFTRFFKTRSLAAAQVTAGHVRVNGTRATKPAQAVRPGDTLTFSQGRAIRVVRIVAMPQRRGPAPEARACYDDMSPPAPPSAAEQGAPDPVAGRVGRKERRAGRLSRQGPLD